MVTKTGGRTLYGIKSLKYERTSRIMKERQGLFTIWGGDLNDLKDTGRKQISQSMGN